MINGVSHSCLFRTNLVSFRTFRRPLFHKPVYWLGLFCRFLQQDSSSNSNGQSFSGNCCTNRKVYIHLEYVQYFFKTWIKSSSDKIFVEHINVLWGHTSWTQWVAMHRTLDTTSVSYCIYYMLTTAMYCTPYTTNLCQGAKAYAQVAYFGLA